MNARRFTFLFLVASLGVVLLALGSLRNSTTENVVQATGRHATSGHTDRGSQAFTHWNNDDPPVVPTQCAACHGTPGFLDFLGEDGSAPGTVDQAAPAGEVVQCNACHNPSAHALERVAFNSGAEVEPVGSEAPCLICHQSRQSTDSVEAALQGLADDVVSPDLSFIDPHYKIAASTQRGSAARSGYQYPDRQYAGYFAHAAGAEICTDCHNPHSLAVQPQLCATCHSNVAGIGDLTGIRTQPGDYDGDGDTREGIHSEVVSLHERLLDALQQYARSVAGKPIVYGAAFPYFVVDSNDNGMADPEEMNPGNRYDAWTPRMIRAAYNYQFVQKDGGGYVHNARYVLQLLHDSLVDLGETRSLPAAGLSRP